MGNISKNNLKFMNQQIQNEDLMQQAIDDYYINRNFTEALKKIDSYLVINPRFIPFPYQFKTDILRDQGKIDEAIEVVNIGLSIFPKSHDLLKRRAELVGFYKGDFQDALQDIGRALIFFEGYSNDQTKFLNQLDTKENLNYSKSYTSTKVDLKILEQDLARSNIAKFTNAKIDNLKEEINDIKKDIINRFNENKKQTEKDKFTNIELLGIFTAILGFVFANAQKMAVFSNLTDAFEFNIAFAIPIVLFFLLIKLFSK